MRKRIGELLFGISLTCFAFANSFDSKLSQVSRLMCLPKELVYATILKESKGDAFAYLLNQNRSLDVGIGQINSVHYGRVMNYIRTSNDLIAKVCGLNILWDPLYNAVVGVSVLAKCLDIYGFNFLGGVICYGSQTEIRHAVNLQTQIIKKKGKDFTILQGKCISVVGDTRTKEIYMVVNPFNCSHLIGYINKWMVELIKYSPAGKEVKQLALNSYKKGKIPFYLFHRLYPLDSSCLRYWNYGYFYWKNEGPPTRPNMPSRINLDEFYSKPYPLVGYYFNMVSEGKCTIVEKVKQAHAPKGKWYDWLDLNLLAKISQGTYRVPIGSAPFTVLSSRSGLKEKFINSLDDQEDLDPTMSDRQSDWLRKIWSVIF